MFGHRIRRSYLIAIPAVLLTASLNILCSGVAQAAPAGSYAKSCSSISVSGSTLTASCLNTVGASTSTALNSYPQCLGDIKNSNGTLICSSAGSYTKSCSSISITGSTLNASCVDMSGNSNATALTNYAQCTGDISNVAGSLSCATKGNIGWGAAGHNDRMSLGSNSTYNTITIDQQMKLLKSAGLNWYRTACEPADCSLLVSAAQANGISLLFVLEPRPDDTQSESANYTLGYQFALSISSAYIGKIKYYEASSELDVWTGLNGSVDGSQRSMYNQARYVLARGFTKGMIDGIHAGDPSALAVVGDTGWCHYGFLQALWADGVRWDVTSFYWYAAQGNVEHAGCNGANVAAIHASFGLPVWITEFNSNTAAQNNDPAAESAWVTQFMAQIDGISSAYRIRRAFAYELLDEPAQQGQEAHFGLFNADGTPKSVVSSMAKYIQTD